LLFIICSGGNASLEPYVRKTTIIMLIIAIAAVAGSQLGWW
jgi:hypothetical protein